MKRPSNINENERVARAIEGCLGYGTGKFTLQQVWYRVRGDRNREFFQKLEDDTLRHELYALSVDFFACYGYDNELLDARIRGIARYLQRGDRPKLEPRCPEIESVRELAAS